MRGSATPHLDQRGKLEHEPTSHQETDREIGVAAGTEQLELSRDETRNEHRQASGEQKPGFKNELHHFTSALTIRRGVGASKLHPRPFAGSHGFPTRYDVNVNHIGAATMAYEHILFDEADGVATLTINRPERMNALHVGVIAEMIDVVDKVRDQGSARVLVMTGTGRAFCSGADLAGGGAGGGGGGGPVDAGKVLETHFNPLLERLFALPVPFITVVNGVAAGAGCSYALAGDIVIAARSAYFLQAFVNIGLVPDVGSTWLLPRLVGKARAQAMMMLGERIPAETALDWGMIYKVVDDADLAAEAGAIAAKLAKGPTRSYALIRQGIRDSLDKTLTEALMVERRNQLQAGRSSDFGEGVTAFLQKRPTAFTGK